jgi:hypothetical protein
MRNVSDKSCRENKKKSIFINKFFSRKLCLLWDNMEKTQNELLLFHDNNGYANAPQCYITRNLPVISYFFCSTHKTSFSLFLCYTTFFLKRIKFCQKLDYIFARRIIDRSVANVYPLFNGKYKVVQIWPGLFVCKQVTVCPGHILNHLVFTTFADHLLCMRPNV